MAAQRRCHSIRAEPPKICSINSVRRTCTHSKNFKRFCTNTMGIRLGFSLRCVLGWIAWIAFHCHLIVSGWLWFLLPVTGAATMLFLFRCRRVILAIILTTIACAILGLTESLSSAWGLPPDTPILSSFRLERAAKDVLVSAAYSLSLSSATGFLVWYGRVEWELWHSRR